MKFRDVLSKSLHSARRTFLAVTIFQFSLGGPLVGSLQAKEHEGGERRTPIKHLIVLIGENRSFDHVFATYVSPSGDHVSNLL